MAVKDVKPTKSRYNRGGGWGGSSSSRYYDDEGRGESKDTWEWFEKYFLSSPTLEHLLALDKEKCYMLLKNSVIRYRLMDIAYIKSPGWFEADDTRAHKLVLEYLNEAEWVVFHDHLVLNYNNHKEDIVRTEHERAEEREGEWKAYLAQQEAKKNEIYEKDLESVEEFVEVTAGLLESEINQVFVSTDKIGSDGSWIEDVVDCYTMGDGFGYTQEKAVGVKLQVTLSLDLSNSMVYNRVHESAANAFRDLGLSLRTLREEYPNDIYVAFFVFSDDTFDSPGKRVDRLTVPAFISEDRAYFGEFENYKPSRIDSWDFSSHTFSGTDTWLYPLLEHISMWEESNSDPGAVKLDIVITDAVLEHRTDISKCNAIQTKRNGNLQTVLLNFISPEEAVNTTLPHKCYQLLAESDNVVGLLRNIISDFISVNL